MAIVQPAQQCPERLGVDLPTHRGRRSWWRGGLAAGPHDLAGVVVDSEHVDRAGDQVEIAVGDLVRGPGKPLDAAGRISEPGDRLDEPAVLEIVTRFGQLDIRRIGAGRDGGGEIEHDPGRGPGREGADPLEGEAVAEQQVMGGGEPGPGIAAPRRVLARDVAVVGRHVRLVERHPGVDPITETLDHRRGVIGKGLGRRANRPSAGILERLREVPVVQRRPRRDPDGEKRVDEPVVEVEAGGVDRTAAAGYHAWPGDREPVGTKTELVHQGDIALPPGVVLAGAVARGPVVDRARSAGEPIPDALPSPVSGGRPFDLVGGGRRAPDEPLGERHRSGRGSDCDVDGHG